MHNISILCFWPVGYATFEISLFIKLKKRHPYRFGKAAFFKFI